MDLSIIIKILQIKKKIQKFEVLRKKKEKVAMQ